MGTQQILMIVLSVIVVGAAIAVGIDMFNMYSRQMDRFAIAIELNNIAINGTTWWRTPAMLGGGQNGTLTPAPSREGFINFLGANANGVLPNTVNATFTIGALNYQAGTVPVTVSNSRVENMNIEYMIDLTSGTLLTPLP